MTAADWIKNNPDGHVAYLVNQPQRAVIAGNLSRESLDEIVAHFGAQFAELRFIRAKEMAALGVALGG